MTQPAITVENLSKLYSIGLARQRHDTLRDLLTDNLRNLGQSLRRAPRSQDDVLWALKDVSFEVQPGEAVGIIGRNGAGKSTLLKILSRITEPTTGRAVLNGRVGSLLEVGTGFHPELTGRENIYLNGAILGMHRSEIERKFDEIVAFSEIERFLDTPVKRYSSGMYVRLAFAVAAHLEPEILIVDEVLAVGDAEFQRKCLGKMGNVAGEGRTVLFVSHNMNSINELCEKSILLDVGRIVDFSNTTRIIDSYLKRKVSTKRKISVNDVLDRRYSGPLKILSVWLEDKNGKENYRFNQHDDVVFCLNVKAYSQPVVIGISVRDIHNQVLIFLSNINDKVILSTASEDAIIKIRLKDVLLRSGDYLITFVLNDGNNIFCERWGDVISMSISEINEGKLLSFAPYRFQAEWKISD